MKFFKKWKREERGSVTVEASISMVVFMFFIISLLQFINISRAQMLIQVALNKSAQEMAQYMYLYKITGLYDTDMAMQSASEQAAGTISTATNQVDNVLSAFETLSGDISNGGTTGADTANASSMQGFVDRLQLIASDAQNVGQTVQASSGEIKGIIQTVKDNPTAFVKSLAALGISKGMDQLKSFLFGDILGAAMVEKYLDTDYADADTRLRFMNVIDGMDGLSFRNSTVFMQDAKSAGGAKDINLVVVYKVRLFPLFSRDFTTTLAQGASVQAWLGGDAEFTVFTEPAPAEEGDDSDSDGNEADNDADGNENGEDGDGTEPEDGGNGEEEPAEEEPANEEPQSEEEEKAPSLWDTMEGRMTLQNAYLMKETMLNPDVYYIEVNGYQFLYDASSGKVTGVIVNSITDYEEDSTKKDVLLAAANNGVTTTNQVFDNALMNGGTLTATKDGKTITINQDSVKEYSVTIIVPKDSDPGTDFEQSLVEKIGEASNKKYSFDIEEMDER